MNIATDKDISQEKPLEAPIVETNIKSKVYLSVGVIMIVLLLTVFFLKWGQNTQQITRTTTSSQGALEPKESNEVTGKTIIAKTLDVPPLYRDIIWQDVTDASHEAFINSITFSDRQMIPLKGHFWHADVVSTIQSEVERYYYDELEKRGWFGSNGAGLLHFTNFTLTPPASGGPCGGVYGFLGYKDGEVRLVTVARSMTPCNPLSLIPTPSNYNISYTVFVSDLIPLQEIRKIVNLE